MKERSKRNLCVVRNASGNTLDSAILCEIKKAAEDKCKFIELLEKSKNFYAWEKEPFESILDDLKAEKEKNDVKVAALVDSLIEIGESSARKEISKRIETLGKENDALDAKITEYEGLSEQHFLHANQFEILRDLLVMFSKSVDSMTVEQRRSAMRTLVWKVVWDGSNAHVYFFGADGEAELPEIDSDEDQENLEANLNGWGEDSKSLLGEGSK